MSDRQALIEARIDEGYPPAAAANMVDVEMNEDAALCFDCGIDAWGFEEDGADVHEDYYVSNVRGAAGSGHHSTAPLR